MIQQIPQTDEFKQKLRDSLHHRRVSSCHASNLGDRRGVEMVLSIPMKGGRNVKYLIKSPQSDALEAARKEGISKEKVSPYEMSQLGTALNIGEIPLPAGVAVKIAN